MWHLSLAPTASPSATNCLPTEVGMECASSCRRCWSGRKTSCCARQRPAARRTIRTGASAVAAAAGGPRGAPEAGKASRKTGQEAGAVPEMQARAEEHPTLAEEARRRQNRRPLQLRGRPPAQPQLRPRLQERLSWCAPATASAAGDGGCYARATTTIPSLLMHAPVRRRDHHHFDRRSSGELRASFQCDDIGPGTPRRPALHRVRCLRRSVVRGRCTDGSRTPDKWGRLTAPFALRKKDGSKQNYIRLPSGNAYAEGHPHIAAGSHEQCAEPLRPAVRPWRREHQHAGKKFRNIVAHHVYTRWPIFAEAYTPMPSAQGGRCWKGEAPIGVERPSRSVFGKRECSEINTRTCPYSQHTHVRTKNTRTHGTTRASTNTQTNDTHTRTHPCAQTHTHTHTHTHAPPSPPSHTHIPTRARTPARTRTNRRRRKAPQLRDL